jgi:hypothetical protein
VRPGDDLGGLGRAGQRARVDGGERDLGEAFAERLGLGDPGLVERAAVRPPSFLPVAAVVAWRIRKRVVIERPSAVAAVGMKPTCRRE